MMTILHCKKTIIINIVSRYEVVIKTFTAAISWVFVANQNGIVKPVHKNPLIQCTVPPFSKDESGTSSGLSPSLIRSLLEVRKY